MISPIKKSDNKSRVNEETAISQERFEYLLKEVYDVMLQYSRMRNVFLRKDNPLHIGNVTFWFEADLKTNESMLKFNKSARAWNEDLILQDIQLYTHDLYYGN